MTLNFDREREIEREGIFLFKNKFNEFDFNKIKKKKFLLNPFLPKQETEKCAICYDNFKNKEEVSELDCSHIFHPKCIKTWLFQKNICPCCKARVNVK